MIQYGRQLPSSGYCLLPQPIFIFIFFCFSVTFLWYSWLSLSSNMLHLHFPGVSEARYSDEAVQEGHAAADVLPGEWPQLLLDLWRPFFFTPPLMWASLPLQFNDALMYTTPVQSGQYKFNSVLSLAGMKVGSVFNHDSTSVVFIFLEVEAVVISWFL